MYQNITKTLAIFGGGAALFYTIGFTIVKTYTYEVGLDGMFWFTKEFYIDAGASFLLEMVRAPLMSPFLFLAYLLLLMSLLPKEKNLLLFEEDGNTVANKEVSSRKNLLRIKLLTIFLLLLATFLYAINYDNLLGNTFFLEFIGYVTLNPANKSFSDTHKSLLFFSFVMPMIIAFGILLYRLRLCFSGGHKNRLFYQIAAVIYIVFFAIIPISYGLHLYDWKLVPVKDPGIFDELSSQVKGESYNAPGEGNLKIWLLGRFGDKYLFFTKNGENGDGVIEVINEGKIRRLNFDPGTSASLRYQMERKVETSVAQFMEEAGSAFKYLELSEAME